MGNNFSKLLWFRKSKLSLFYILFVLISLLVLFEDLAHASNIDDQTLRKIRVFLNIPVNEINDERLRDVLNKEIETGISLGEHIAMIISQLQFGLQLRSGNYLAKYQAFFNAYIDVKIYLYIIEFGVQACQELIAATGQFTTQTIYEIYETVQASGDLHDTANSLIAILENAVIDRALGAYINAGGATNDTAAWEDVKCILPVSLQTEKVHDYYRNAWAAYTLASADNYVNIIKDLKNQVFSLALPKAVISADPTQGIVPLTVHFDASDSTGTEGQSIQGWLWDYNDGYSGWGLTTIHQFDNTGTYLVRLTVTDSAGLENSTTQKITVKSPVHARFTPPDNSPPPLTYHYDASASTDDKGSDHISSDSSYVWNFNNEATAVGKEVDYTFSTEGFKLITLTVTDDLGYSDTEQKAVYVGHGGPTFVNGGTITGNIKWTAFGSPYIVQGNITVAEGGALTIEPGVRVELAGGSDFMWCMAYGGPCFQTGAQIEVRGTLTAKGATFTWADGQNQWTGIWFEGAGSSNSRLEDCVIEHAAGASRVTWCGWGCICGGHLGIITIKDSSPTVTGCTIKNSNAGHGIWLSNSAAEISNNIIDGTGTGIGVGNDLQICYVDVTPAFPPVTGNTIKNNNTGIFVGGGSGGVYQGNMITGNTSYGLYYSGSAVLDATNCNWGNNLWTTR